MPLDHWFWSIWVHKNYAFGCILLLLSLLFCEKCSCRLQSVWCLTGNWKQTSDWVTPSLTVRSIMSFGECLSEYAAQILQLLLCPSFPGESIFDSLQNYKRREISKQLKSPAFRWLWWRRPCFPIRLPGTCTQLRALFTWKCQCGSGMFVNTTERRWRGVLYLTWVMPHKTSWKMSAAQRQAGGLWILS